MAGPGDGAEGSIEVRPCALQAPVVNLRPVPIDVLRLRPVGQIEDLEPEGEDVKADAALILGELWPPVDCHGEVEVLVPIAEHGRFVINGIAVDEELHGRHRRVRIVLIATKPPLAMPIEHPAWREKTSDDDDRR